jgi:hypothetical protein
MNYPCVIKSRQYKAAIRTCLVDYQIMHDMLVRSIYQSVLENSTYTRVRGHASACLCTHLAQQGSHLILLRGRSVQVLNADNKSADCFLLLSRRCLDG